MDIEKIHDILHRFDISEALLKNQSDDLSALDINIQDNNGFTALMVEIIRGETNAVELLLNHGALTEIENESGETALMLAVEEDNPFIVELVAMYADVNYTNIHGDTAFGLAKYYEYKDIISILKKHGAIDSGKITHIEEIEASAFGSKDKK